jgi:hypothetical protein
MAARRLAGLAAVGVIVLATGFLGLGVWAGEDNPGFRESPSAVETRPKPARGNKMIDNAGSRYQPATEKSKKSKPEGRFTNANPAPPASPDKTGRRATADVRREKLAKMIAARLEKLPPAGKAKAKKEPDDHFVVGTSEVNWAKSHADVRFESVQGQKEVAALLADYVVNAPEQTLRQWHVFARVKSADEAESFLKDLRAQWDAMDEIQARQAAMARQAEFARSTSLAYRSASDLRGQMGGYARTACRT